MPESFISKIGDSEQPMKPFAQYARIPFVRIIVAAYSVSMRINISGRREWTAAFQCEIHVFNMRTKLA